MSLSALRLQLAEVVDAGQAAPAPALSTGIAALDRLLPGGAGLPRGRITEVVGRSGKTTFVRRVVEEAVMRRGLWVAYVDAARTLAPRDWAHLGAHEGFWTVRPRDPARGAWCADVLLRSGAFALVVLDGAPPPARPVAVRLSRLARAGGTALLLLADESAGRASSAAPHPAPPAPPVPLPGTVRLRVGPASPRRHGPALRGTGASTAHADAARRLAIVVERGGTPGAVEASCTIVMPRRLSRAPEPRDRRAGGARGGRSARTHR